MKIVTQYILKQMLFGFFLITAGLLMIVWLSQSLRLFDILLNSKVSVWLFIQLTMMLIPGYLAIISPIALFAVALFTYNRLITDRELIILRAAGMSPLELAKPVMAIGFLFTILGFYISLVLVPNAVANFRELRWKIQHDVSHLLIQEGEFNDIANGITVYIRSKNKNGSLEGIILHDQHSPASQVTLLAEKGSIIYRDGIPHISMQNGSRQEVSNKTGRFSILYFDHYNTDFVSNREKAASRFKNPGERSLKELFFTPQNVLPNLKTFHRFRLEGFKRLSLPFFNLSFMMIAAAGLLTGTFNRRGHNKRIIITILIMAGVQILELGTENLCLRNLYFIPLLYVLSISPAFICLYVLKHSGSFQFTGIKTFLSKCRSFIRRPIKKRSAAGA
ncbi:MAG: LPS export ABC transporter permease LptF [Alphaproteobacteria bacterium]|nr:LPS export ABC transporter permease LptF [Alphaproteobacteria bacterium]MBO4643966.1 LPS export ABC transporter permease LptF [Alphaproteobacteria bacterium]